MKSPEEVARILDNLPPEDPDAARHAVPGPSVQLVPRPSGPVMAPALFAVPAVGAILVGVTFGEGAGLVVLLSGLGLLAVHALLSRRS